jgi:hypothetical protein
MFRIPRLIVVLAGCIALAGCTGGASQDVTKLIQSADVRTGWFDAGVENGMNKLVPSLTLTLKNVSSQPVSNLQLNAVIRRAGEAEEWGGAFARAVGSEGLAPGASTKPITLRSNLGYTGVEPRAQMLKNSQFLDAHVQLFIKRGGSQWAKLGEWTIARELMTQ